MIKKNLLNEGKIQSFHDLKIFLFLQIFKNSALDAEINDCKRSNGPGNNQLKNPFTVTNNPKKLCHCYN